MNLRRLIFFGSLAAPALAQADAAALLSITNPAHDDSRPTLRLEASGACQVRYFGSQPWPFPHSLMLGFQADYESGAVSPQEGEIEDAGFYRVDALPKTFPGNISISQWLLRDFVRRRGEQAG